MARPKRGKSRRQSDDYLVDHFMGGEMPTDPDEALALLSLSDAALAEVWTRYRAVVMRAWSHPGCRPWGWWRFDAPRLPLPGTYLDRQLPEPRLFVSGAGRPRHEVSAYAPLSAYGIWAWTGDPDNPPAHETQYAYLRRHGLLDRGERQGPELQPDPPSIEAQR